MTLAVPERGVLLDGSDVLNNIQEHSPDTVEFLIDPVDSEAGLLTLGLERALRNLPPNAPVGPAEIAAAEQFVAEAKEAVFASHVLPSEEAREVGKHALRTITGENPDITGRYYVIKLAEGVPELEATEPEESPEAHTRRIEREARVGALMRPCAKRALDALVVGLEYEVQGGDDTTAPEAALLLESLRRTIDLPIDGTSKVLRLTLPEDSSFLPTSRYN